MAAEMPESASQEVGVPNTPRFICLRTSPLMALEK
jgi:hypothetical protein